MFRKLAVMILVTAMAAVLAVPVAAEESDADIYVSDEENAGRDACMETVYISGDHKYVNASYGVEFRGFTGDPGAHVVIPSRIEGKPVKGIGKGAFNFNSTMTTVTIPDTVERILGGAFNYCSVLVAVKLPDSLKFMAAGAFTNCRSLQMIDIPLSLALSDNTSNISTRGSTQFSGSPFKSCDHLTSVRFSDEMYNIPSGFLQETMVQRMTLPSALKTIRRNLFNGCVRLTDIVIPRGLSAIEDAAFKGCTNLQSVLFMGSEAEWESISKGKNNDPLLNADISFAITPIPEPDPVIPRDEFSDVTDTSSSIYRPVYWAVDRGLIKGFDDGTFRPEDSCTREQFVVMIWRLADKPVSAADVNFTDIDSSRSTYRAVRWAVEQGIIKGFSDGTFAPEETVTRQQVAIMLWRMAGEPSFTEETDFDDVSGSGAGYKSVQWGAEAGLIKGFADGTFRPEEECLRQQIVIFLYRYAGRVLGESLKNG